MAHATFPVEVLTPDGVVFADEVEMVSTRTSEGLIGILARHSPLVATLEPTELRLYKSETEIVRFAQSEGYLQVRDNHALLLVEQARPPEELDADELRAQLQAAEEQLDAAGDDVDRRRAAERERRRFEQFLSLTR